MSSAIRGTNVHMAVVDDVEHRPRLSSRRCGSPVDIKPISVRDDGDILAEISMTDGSVRVWSELDLAAARELRERLDELIRRREGY